MNRITVLACATVLFASCNSGDNSSTETVTGKDSSTAATVSAAPDGWTSLFDGVSTAGWHRYGGGPAGPSWKVADGVLILDTTGKKDGGNLVTNDEYENFDLKLEWKIAKNGNSGVIFYCHEDSVKYKEPYETGPEMQIVDNDGHPDGKIVKHMAGDLYDLIACSTKTVKAVDEWNESEIKASNGKLDLYLNGTAVVSTTMWDNNWSKMIASSKFKAWPGFGTFKKGHIVLQDHGNMVSFRNIRIKQL